MTTGPIFDTFERNGIRLSVASSGTGRPMVFQHGLCGDAGQPADVFPSECGWRCETLECRGHGKSELGPVDGISIETFANDLAGWIESKGWAPVALGGISMGAAIALRLAVMRPKLVSGLVIARPAWLASAAPDNMRPNALVGQLLQTSSGDDALRQFEETDAARNLDQLSPDNMASLRGFFRREPLQETASLLTRISNDGPGISQDEITAIRLPVLVVGVERDAIHPIAYAKTLAHWIPGARFMEVTSKSVNKERYRIEFKDALADFFNSLKD